MCDPFVNEPERLIDAAAAIEAALDAIADPETGGCPYPPALLAMTDHPPCLDEFTPAELHAATEFLCRVGVLVPLPTFEN